MICTYEKLSLGEVKKYYLVYLALMLMLMFFQDLVEDFVFPASKLIVEARNGSGTCGPLKTFHVVQIIKGKSFSLCGVPPCFFFFCTFECNLESEKNVNIVAIK